MELKVAAVKTLFNPSPRTGEGIIGMHFVSPSITFLVRSITYALMNYHRTWYKCCPHWDIVLLTQIHSSKVKVTQDI